MLTNGTLFIIFCVYNLEMFIESMKMGYLSGAMHREQTFFNFLNCTYLSLLYVFFFPLCFIIKKKNIISNLKYSCNSCALL